MEKISDFLREFGVVVLVGLLGCGVLIYGFWGIFGTEESVVEIVKTDQSAQPKLESRTGEIVVDIAGAVVKPGLYTLPSGSRIGDALVQAGGLAEKADRSMVAKSINLAEVLNDGAKVFIPELKPVGQSQNQSEGKVNLNTAELSELDDLDGIGPVRAKQIIDSRPYARVEELVSKAKIPESVYANIKDQVSCY